MRLRTLGVSLALATIASCKLEWAAYAGKATSYGPVDSHTMICCDGSCQGAPPNYINTCQQQDEFCVNANYTQTCGTTGVMVQNETPKVADTNFGPCEPAASGCTWKMKMWTYKCFQCPAGFKGAHFGFCHWPGDSYPVYPGDCVRCTKPGEELAFEFGEFGPKALTWSCVEVNGSCEMGPKGLKLLKKSEHLCVDFYDDSKGHKAIGYGHDCCANDDCDSIAPLTPLTEDQADQLLQCDLKRALRLIKEIPGVSKMNINQFQAFVDFTFNVGHFSDVFAPQVKAQDWSAICPLLATNKYEVNKDRREAQAKLCADQDHAIPSGCQEPGSSSSRRGLDHALDTDVDWEAEFEARQVLSDDPFGSGMVSRAADPLCHAWTAGKKQNCVGAGCVDAKGKSHCKYKTDSGTRKSCLAK